MKVKKFFSALASCTAILLCSMFACACVGVATTTQSTKQIVETQEEIKETIEQQEAQEVAKEEPQQPTIVNNYIDNSVTNIDNSVTNIDNSTTIIETQPEPEPEPVVVEQPSTTINSKTNDEGITIPVGDERLDTNPNPYIVHIKHLQCPKCGAYEYLEHYNKQDTNLVHYIGSCSACNYEY